MGEELRHSVVIDHYVLIDCDMPKWEILKRLSQGGIYPGMRGLSRLTDSARQQEVFSVPVIIDWGRLLPPVRRLTDTEDEEYDSRN